MPVLLAIAASAVFGSEPIRVALLDFENSSGASSSPELMGGLNAEGLAGKGLYVLGFALSEDPAYAVIDRRDFIRQIQDLSAEDSPGKTRAQPSFLRAAQAMNADVVVRGVLLSCSPGMEVVEQGGIKTEFHSLGLRVSLQALDTRDGSVIAMVEGSARRKFRQSSVQRTTAGEDELMDLLKSAVTNAVPALSARIVSRMELQSARRKVMLSIETGASDPALVEIDGILVGSTPLVDFPVFAGDHVITVGKAGYRDVSKRVMLEKDTAIEAPLFRAELSADEMKEVFDKARINVVLGAEPAWIINEMDSSGKTEGGN